MVRSLRLRGRGSIFMNAAVGTPKRTAGASTAGASTKGPNLSAGKTKGPGRGPSRCSEVPLASERYVSEDQNLSTHVEVDLVGELEEIYQDVRVLCFGTDRVLL